MRALSRAVWLTILMAIVVLSSVQCSQQSDAGDAVRPGAATNATASSVQSQITLPSFTALVNREGPAVVNISITQKVSVDFFAALIPARNCRTNIQPNRWVLVLSLVRMATL